MDQKQAITQELKNIHAFKIALSDGMFPGKYSAVLVQLSDMLNTIEGELHKTLKSLEEVNEEPKPE